ncbi:helix-turn-helix transcriptional regulator [bacterium]|nr:helix-turn-helix transcriptional regulator [bacterium]
MTSKSNKISAKIGLKIVLERTKRKLSQEKLAELSDLSKTALGAIERGTSSPSIDTLDRIAAALEIELSDLVKVKSVDL